MSNAPAETRFHFRGSAGRLAGIYRPASSSGLPAAAALLCHPHPLYGGTMHNKTLYRIAKRLPLEAGIPTLRFDFRGAGGSEGTHDGGRGEMEDTRAALAELRRLTGMREDLQLIGIGYSFGAAIGLRALATETGFRHLIALGLPLQLEWDLSFLMESPLPCLVVQGERDEYGAPERLETLLERRDAPTTLEIIPGADHLFVGVEDLAVDAVLRYVLAQFSNEE